MKKVLSLLLAFILCFSSVGLMVSAEEKELLPYQDPSLSAEERTADLLSRMTVKQKLAQCIQGERKNFNASGLKQYEFGSLLSGGGSVPSPNNSAAWANMVDNYQKAMEETELGIPIIYGVDAVHGHNNVVNATIFPHNIGLGATHNVGLVEQIAHATAREVAATGIYWSFGPCTAIPKNIRWGRSYEGYSSDINLVTEMAEAYVVGFQGTTLEGYKDSDTIAGCAKHYALEGWTGNGANQGNVILPDDYQTNEEYIENVLLPALAPYQAAIDAGVLTLMPSFNSINGLKCHENYFLLTTILKERMGFDGFVVGDWNGHDQCSGTTMYPTSQYPNLTSKQRRDIACFNAGLDMFMCGNSANDATGALASITYGYENGYITDERLDDAVTRILNVKFKLGLFDERRYSDPALLDVIRCEEHRDIARQAVRESLVLLKNDNDIVGKLADMDRVFVAGKSANNIGYQCGGWTISWQGGSGNTTAGVSILAGIQQNSKASDIKFSQDGKGSTGYDVAIAVLGEKPYAEGNGDAGEAALKLDSTDVQCLNNIRQENPDIPLVVILVSGRPMLIQDYVRDWDGFVAAWLPGSEGDGVGQVLFDKQYDFKGTLSFNWPAYFKAIESTPQLEGDSEDLDTIWKIGYGLKKGEEGGELIIPEEPAPEAVQLPGRIKLADYVAAADGVQTENTSDSDGGLNVGYFDAGRWVKHYVNITKGGLYKLTLRYSANNNTAADHINRAILRDGNGNNIVGFNTVNCAGWQNWRSTEAQAILSEGVQYIDVYSRTGNLNVNWLDFEYIGDQINKSTVPGTVEAESFYQASSTPEIIVDGENNYVKTAANETMDYYLDVQEEGRYGVSYRIANAGAESSINVMDGSGALINTIKVPGTGSASVFTEISDIMYLKKGEQALRLSPASSDIIMDSFTFVPVTSIPQGDEALANAVTPIFSSESNPGSNGWFGTEYLIDYTLSEQNKVAMSTQGSGATYSKISIDPNQQYQTINGFGASLDETVVRNLMRMKPEFRTEVLKKLVDPATGIGLDTFRVSIGSSDACSKVLYTYNDVQEGELDVDLSNFSIQKDIDYGIIEVMKEILAINPNVKFVASPWSAPGFMKQSSDSANNAANVKQGFLKSYYIEYLAEYFAKYVKAYQEQGIEIYAMTMQNAPEAQGEFPCTSMSANQQKLLLNALGDVFAANKIDTKIWIGDTNVSTTNAYVSQILANNKAFQYADGIAVQTGAGTGTNLAAVNANYPSKEIAITSGTVYGAGGFRTLIDYFNSGATTYIAGPAMFDTRATGYVGTSISPSLIMQVNTGTTQAEYDTYYMLPEYYMLGQFSKYIENGARVLETSGSAALPTIAVQNPDGKIVAIVANSASVEKYATIEIGGYFFNAIIPAGTVATYLLGDTFAAQEPVITTGKAVNAVLDGNIITLKVEGSSFVASAVNTITCDAAIQSISYVDANTVKIVLEDTAFGNYNTTYTVTVPASAVAGADSDLTSSFEVRGTFSDVEAISVPTNGMIDPRQGFAQRENIVDTTASISSKTRGVISAAAGKVGYSDYVLDVEEAGEYVFQAYYQGTNPASNYGSIEFQLDGEVIRVIDLPALWVSPRIQVTMDLPEGRHTLRVLISSSTAKLSEFSIAKPAVVDLSDTDTVRLQAENFVNADKGIVENEKNTSYGHAYNFYEYYVNVPTAGWYNLVTTASSTYDGAGLRIETCDGKYVSFMDITNTGAWATMANNEGKMYLEAGIQKVRLIYLTTGVNIDYIDITMAQPEFGVTLPDSIIKGEVFQVTIQTPSDYQKLVLMNENDRKVGFTVISKSVNDDGSVSTVIELWVGTQGKGRVLSVFDRDTHLGDFTFDVDPVPTQIFSVEAPASVEAGKVFQITATTTPDLVKAIVHNEVGRGVGISRVSKMSIDGKYIATYDMMVGTPGENRTFTFKADFDKMNNFNYTMDFTMDITPKAAK